MRSFNQTQYDKQEWHEEWQGMTTSKDWQPQKCHFMIREDVPSWLMSDSGQGEGREQEWGKWEELMC